MWKLIKKYTLMEDIRQIGLVSHFCYLAAFTIPTIIFGSIIVFMTISTYAYDFHNLTPLSGVIQVESYNIVYKKSGTIKPVINLSVISGSKKIPYKLNSIESSDQIFQQQDKINNQKVKIWYLPQNNQFYLIHFQDNSLNQLDFAKQTKEQLFREIFYFKLIFPELSIITLILILSFQLFFIRNFLVKWMINADKPRVKLTENILALIMLPSLYLGTPVATIFILKGLIALKQILI